MQGLDLSKPPTGGAAISAEMRTNYAAIATCNKGAVAPALLYEGMLWLDSSISGNVKLKIYLNAAWKTLLEHVEQLPAAPMELAGKARGYVHEQTVPASAWSVGHGLNKFPSVMVVDHATPPKTIDPADITDIEFTDANTVTIHFTGTKTGFAYIN
jgi:hypothetical protein